MKGDLLLYGYWFWSSWLVAQRAATTVGVGDQRGFDNETSALVSSRVSHSGSPFALQFIHSYLVFIRDCLQGYVCSRKGFSAGKPKSFAGSSDLSLPSKPRHWSHHRYHTPVPGDYQIRSCSSGVVISNLGIKGAWAAKPLDQFASHRRDLRASTCVMHPLWHRNTTTYTNY